MRNVRLSWLGLLVLASGCATGPRSEPTAGSGVPGEVALSQAPAMELRIQDGPSVDAGGDFWTVFTALPVLWNGADMPAMDRLAWFQCAIVFDPEVLQPVEAEASGTSRALGWSAELAWDKQGDGAVARVTARAPGASTGLRGYGDLVRVRFHVREGAAGPTYLHVGPSPVVVDMADQSLFAFQGLAANTGGWPVPIRGPGHAGPDDGLGWSELGVIPRRTCLLAANPERGTVRVCLDRPTSRLAKDRAFRWILAMAPAAAERWESLPLKSVIPVGEDGVVLQVDPKAADTFDVGDRLKLDYGTDAALSQTQPFPVLAAGSPAGVDGGIIQAARLTHQDQARESYSASTPPTLEARVVYEANQPWEHEWAWLLFGPDGRTLGRWGAGPRELRKVVALEPEWPDGEYRVLLVAFNTRDRARTTFTSEEIVFQVRQE